jgi:hypothetical protein
MALFPLIIKDLITEITTYEASEGGFLFLKSGMIEKIGMGCTTSPL